MNKEKDYHGILIDRNKN